MKLEQLLKGLGEFTVKGNRRIEISSIAHNSKQVQGQGLFFAIEGNESNGYDFIDESISRGAVCIVAEENFIAYKDITKIIVKDIRKSCAVIAANFYDNPSGRMHVTGITGTNGKTTTLFLINAILGKCGIKCGTIGTIGYDIGSRHIPAVNTTPSPIMLQMFLRDMEKTGIKHCVMEASSHALDQERASAILFDRAVFTNLTPEHLDYHKTMDKYFLAKRKLFSMIKDGGRSIVNIDDEYGRIIAQEFKEGVLTYGIKNSADISAAKIRKSTRGICFNLNTPGYSFLVDSMLIGEHNIYNILAAAAFAFSCNLPQPFIEEAVKDFTGVPGRMERVTARGKDINVFVDYAHTHDALSNALKALNEIREKNIITVFGCGGNRDKAKRPKMASVAALMSDYVVITSDNPRGEEPESIIADIKSGLPNGFDKYRAIVDRRQAIEHALKIACPGDIVLIAGKGHENCQIFKDNTIAFDDRKVAADALNAVNAAGITGCSH
jgi:UDP-N-acetylmuramoyl-L-alanyl-D-glutamate--2,6-diaminopimelate ligase